MVCWRIALLRRTPKLLFSEGLPPLPKLMLPSLALLREKPKWLTGIGVEERAE